MQYSSFRKSTSFASLIVLLGLFGGLAAHAQTTIGVGDRSGAPGTTVHLPVTLSEAGQSAAVQFDLGFDESVLEAGIPLPGTGLADHVLDAMEVAPGQLRITVTTATPSH